MTRYASLVLLTLVVGGSLPGGSLAQEEKAREQKASQQTNLQRFSTLLEMWNDIDRKTRQVIADYRAAPQDKRESLYLQYLSLVQQSHKLLPDLREAAATCYREAPNQNKRVTRTMIGLMANANRFRDYSTAIELGTLLAENKCAEKAYLAELAAARFCAGDFEQGSAGLRAAKDDGPLSALARDCLREVELRDAEAQADDLPRVKLTTTKGDIVLELFENEAPQTVGNFVSLVEKSFYDGLTFHRVLDGFMAQGGCPKGDGTGGPGYKIPCECYRKDHRLHYRGSLAMAHAGRDTGGSQFYITFRRTDSLDGRHTVFGRVIEGMDVVDKLQRIDPNAPDPAITPDKILSAKVLRKRNHPYRPTKVEPVPGR